MSTFIILYGLTVHFLLGHIAVLSTQRRPIVTDQVAWSVGLSVTLVSPAKMAVPIEMLFGLRTRVGPRNHVLDGVQIPHGKGQFEGKGCPIVKYRDMVRSRVKTAEPIEMLFGLYAWMGRRNRVRWGSSGAE